jgi:hypothetical protein
MRYVVTGPHRVFGALPGDVIEMDLHPDQEERMVARGSLAPCPKKARPSSVVKLKRDEATVSPTGPASGPDLNKKGTKT